MPETVCGICWDELTSDAKRHTLQCKHVFHKQCVDHVRLRAESWCCPLCRGASADTRAASELLDDILHSGGSQAGARSPSC